MQVIEDASLKANCASYHLFFHSLSLAGKSVAEVQRAFRSYQFRDEVPDVVVDYCLELLTRRKPKRRSA